MKPEYQLNSRGNIDNRLVRIGEEGSLKYELKTPYNYRVGMSDDEHLQYCFIDPAGGPFMPIGYEIDGHKIKSITKDYIEFE